MCPVGYAIVPPRHQKTRQEDGAGLDLNLSRGGKPQRHCLLCPPHHWKTRQEDGAGLSVSAWSEEGRRKPAASRNGCVALTAMPVS